VRDSLNNPIFTEPRLIAVVRPFNAAPLTPTTPIASWQIKQASKYNAWPTYKNSDSTWNLWKGVDVLLLTPTAPGVSYSAGEYYAKNLTDETNFQGSYGYKDPDATEQVEVYIWSPFDIVLSRIIEVLRLHPDLADLIADRNTIDISGGGILRVTKHRKSTADYPELTIEPAGGAYNMGFSSTSALIVQNYGITLQAAEEVTSRYFFPVKWACIQALSGILQAPNLDLFFATINKVEDIKDTMSELQPKLKTELSVRVEMFIERSILRSY
jgi:hypothetical protein